MSNWQEQSEILYNLGVPGTEVPKSIMKHIKDNIKKKQKLEKVNNQLAGHLKEEYDLPITDEVNKFMVDFSQNSHPALKTQVQKRSANYFTHDLSLGKFWVNLQKKTEFNPVHNHSGLYSFIIFVQIPYKLDDELKLFPETSVAPVTSCLQFIYTDMSGRINTHQVYVDKSFEGKMLMFSSELNHCVYPFYTSNKNRITSSGNIYFLNEKDGFKQP